MNNHEYGPSPGKADAELITPDMLVDMSESAARRLLGFVVQSPIKRQAYLECGKGMVFVKDETVQEGRSFKDRGAGNAVFAFPSDHYVTASEGNHATGLARAASEVGSKATVVVRENMAENKVSRLTQLGAEVVCHGSDFDEASEYALRLSSLFSARLVHPFANQYVVAGQATLGLELLEQAPYMTHLVLPVGGGGLLAGVAGVVKQARPSVQVVAAEVNGCDAYAQSLEAGKSQTQTTVDMRFGGLAVRKTHPFNFELARRVTDQSMVLTSDEVYKAVHDHLHTSGVLLETAGATSLAAARKLSVELADNSSSIVAVATGANAPDGLRQYVSAKARRLGWDVPN